METAQEKLTRLIELQKKVSELTNEVFDTVIEIPCEFLKLKGFILTETELENTLDVPSKRSRQYGFTYMDWNGNIEHAWYYNKILFTYSNDDMGDWIYHEWSYLKTSFETFYNRQLKKDFEPKIKKNEKQKFK